jgi:hypothetical protein
LRRQATTSRLAPAGSSRDERLDPFALPLRFEATDHTADKRVRSVELHHERVVLRREFRGIKMALNLPVTAYLGVAIRMEPPTEETMGAVTIGAVRVRPPTARRRRRSTLMARRPSFPLRRKAGRSLVGAAVHSDEREIIARD